MPILRRFRQMSSGTSHATHHTAGCEPPANSVSPRVRAAFRQPPARSEARLISRRGCRVPPYRQPSGPRRSQRRHRVRGSADLRLAICRGRDHSCSLLCRFISHRSSSSRKGLSCFSRYPQPSAKWSFSRQSPTRKCACCRSEVRIY